MDNIVRPVEPMSLEAADRALKKAIAGTPYHPRSWEIPLLSTTISCAVVAFVLSHAGPAARWLVYILLVPMLLAPLALLLIDIVIGAYKLKTAPVNFFGQTLRDARLQDPIVKGLALNGIPWIKEQRVRLFHSMESQTHRTMLLLGRIVSLGIAPLIGGIYLAYQMKQLPVDLGTQDFDFYAVALVLGLYAGYLTTFAHHKRIRSLLLVLEIAEQRLDASKTAHVQ